MKELIQYGLELGKYKLLWELLKAKDIRYERQIAGEVQEFLDRNYKAIIAMRTIDQCRDG